MKYILSAFLIAFMAVPAAAVDYYVDDFYSRIHINSDSSLDIEDDISVVYAEPRHFFEFAIPERAARWAGYGTNLPFYYRIGSAHPYRISEIRIPNHRYRIERRGGSLVVKIGSRDKWLDDRILFNIRYHVENAIDVGPGGSVLRWDVLVNGWDSAVNKASFTVMLPGRLDLRSKDYSATAGGTNIDCRFDGNILSGAAINWIAGNEALTLSICFPSNYIKAPSALSKAFIWLGANPVAILCLLLPVFLVAGLVIAMRLASAKRRDRKRPD